jgi:phage tail tube protein FII
LILGGSARLRRRLQETEVYSKLYYDARVASVVREQLKSSGPTVKAISVVKRVTREMWDNEDEETKRVVAEAVAKAQEVPIEEDVSERTAQQYQE